MFSNSIKPIINGGTFSVISHHLGGFERLEKAVAPSAFHDAGNTFDPPKRHPHTRITVDKIMEWVSGLWEEDREAAILWFYGPAGAGKSTITRKIAELCDLNKLLLATFFFAHSDPSRNNPKSLVATIAYQIAINITETRRKVVAAIERDPLIFNRSLEAQVAALVVDPLRERLEAGYFNTSISRRLIIIDGLDKCDTPAAQCKVLDVISLLLQKYHLPVLILITSRPKRHITHSFDARFLCKYHTTLGLDDTYQLAISLRYFHAAQGSSSDEGRYSTYLYKSLPGNSCTHQPRAGSGDNIRNRYIGFPAA